MKGAILVFLIVCISSPAFAMEGAKFSLSGTVSDNANEKRLEYATVYIEEISLGTVTNIKGEYRLEGIPAGNYRMKVQYLGYATTSLSFHIGRDTVLNIHLDKFSLELEEVSVLGELHPENGSSIIVKGEALKYIQPSSLNDIFQLLPGGLQSDGNLSVANQAVSRQAGSDQNTAFGMAVVMDGAPLSNNGNLRSFSASDGMINPRSVLNGGVDLRMISTDHLDEAEVIRGISSVKYGDMSSGVMVLKSKKGYSPWQVRVKADPLNKLGYVGKGFRLPGKGGTLNAGIDILQGRPDVREQLQKYTRISSSLIYANQALLGGRNLNYDFTVKYYGTLESEKNDPEVMAATDIYKSHYNRFTFTANGGWEVNTSWMNRLDMTFSSDYTADILKREKTVTPIGIIPLVLSKEEGESEGIYLPSEYLSVFREENRPLNLYAQLSAKSILQTGSVVHSLLYGWEFRYDKNVGTGAVYDPERPPYPGSASSRPRPFRSVPAMVKNAFFAEDNIRYERGGHRLDLRAGVRLTNLGNLPQGYRLRGKIFAEPRVNVAYTLPSFDVSGKKSVVTLRLGYGEQVKFPSLDYLYPDKAWFDVPMANYYSQVPENRFLWVMTRMKERVNPDLNADRSRKIEGGFDWKAGGVSVNVNGFYERSNDGYAYSSNHFSFPYKKYEIAGALPGGKPALEDFTAVADTLLKSYSVPVNARRVVKKGVEYSVMFPEIRALRTRIDINGAYYHTAYELSLPESYQPSSYVNGKPYPYAGIYDWNSDSRFREQFNTTVRFATHIPAFRLHFTTSVQVLWFTSSQVKSFSGIPTAYIGTDGITRPFTQAEMNNPAFRQLIRTFSDNYFKRNREPISIGLNLKATKEIGDRMQVSFFVNRLWDYNPVYMNNLKQENRKWEIPFFGAELTVKL